MSLHYLTFCSLTFIYIFLYFIANKFFLYVNFLAFIKYEFYSYSFIDGNFFSICNIFHFHISFVFTFHQPLFFLIGASAYLFATFSLTHVYFISFIKQEMMYLLINSIFTRRRLTSLRFFYTFFKRFHIATYFFIYPQTLLSHFFLEALPLKLLLFLVSIRGNLKSYLS